MSLRKCATPGCPYGALDAGQNPAHCNSHQHERSAAPSINRGMFEQALRERVDQAVVATGAPRPNERVFTRHTAPDGSVRAGAPMPMVPKTALPSGSEDRKLLPMAGGLLDYFPSALAEVAYVSYVGNEKHNPGEPLHWSRGKSDDHADCLLRHLAERGEVDTVKLPDGREFKIRHSAYAAWRALAILQLELEAGGAAVARGAKPVKVKVDRYGDPILEVDPKRP